MVRSNSSVVVMTQDELTDIINAAAKKAAEEMARRINTARPAHVNQTQAAEMLGLSRGTVAAMLRQGTLKLNSAGMIPVVDIDAAMRTG
jgi:predicted DNA-binding protein (UPF0251 family)